MRTLIRYQLARTEHKTLMNWFVPLAGLDPDQERADKVVRIIQGDHAHVYTPEQHAQLLDSIDAVHLELLRQAMPQWWGQFPHGQLLSKQREREANVMSAIRWSVSEVNAHDEIEDDE